jgi:hypothetical protein
LAGDSTITSLRTLRRELDFFSSLAALAERPVDLRPVLVDDVFLVLLSALLEDFVLLAVLADFDPLLVVVVALAALLVRGAGVGFSSPSCAGVLPMMDRFVPQTAQTPRVMAVPAAEKVATGFSMSRLVLHRMQ